MSEANAAQIEFWNGAVGERWATMQARLDAGLTHIADATLAFAAAKPGEHVLDIGCGCATTTLALAEAVGGTGAVTGVDISRPMLAVARDSAAKAGKKIDFIEADASDYAFKPEFDLVFSRFGVMFFADPPGAFANIRKALVPGGRLRFVCWREAPENLWAAAPYAAVRDLLPPQEAPDPHAPGPFAFADGERVKGILEQAGFKNVRVEKLDTSMAMGSGLDEAVEMSLRVGPLARAIAEVDDSTRGEIRDRVDKVLSQFVSDGAVNVPAACWLVAADN